MVNPYHFYCFFSQEVEETKIFQILGCWSEIGCIYIVYVATICDSSPDLRSPCLIESLQHHHHHHHSSWLKSHNVVNPTMTHPQYYRKVRVNDPKLEVYSASFTVFMRKKGCSNLGCLLVVSWPSGVKHGIATSPTNGDVRRKNICKWGIVHCPCLVTRG